MLQSVFAVFQQAVLCSWSRCGTNNVCRPQPRSRKTTVIRRFYAQPRPCFCTAHRQAVLGGFVTHYNNIPQNHANRIERRPEAECCYEQKQLSHDMAQVLFPTTTGPHACHLASLTTKLPSEKRRSDGGSPALTGLQQRKGMGV